MKMVVWQIRLPPDLDYAVRNEAKRQGISHSDVFRVLLRRGLDVTPELLAAAVSKAIDKADRQVLKDMPTRAEIEHIMEATLERILKPYLPS
ncbi:MAG: ribbon-helix-helix protein, CopG family [Peptococcaceae bacterium]|jgi:uncharacterized ferritin-like protein (DUF455 family)|nr:ribbon-helix-helix protein, CopG family [Peptococcaceae bacterium]